MSGRRGIELKDYGDVGMDGIACFFRTGAGLEIFGQEHLRHNFLIDRGRPAHILSPGMKGLGKNIGTVSEHLRNHLLHLLNAKPAHRFRALPGDKYLRAKFLEF